MVVELLDHADPVPRLLRHRRRLLAHHAVGARERTEPLYGEALGRVELAREVDRVKARVTPRLAEQQHEPPEREHARRAADSLTLVRMVRAEFIERGSRELEHLAGH